MTDHDAKFITLSVVALVITSLIAAIVLAASIHLKEQSKAAAQEHDFYYGELKNINRK